MKFINNVSDLTEDNGFDFFDEADDDFEVDDFEDEEVSRLMQYFLDRYGDSVVAG